MSGPEFTPFGKKPAGFILSLETGQLEGSWNVPGGLQNPHDIAVSTDGNTVYVVELNPYRVWKLSNGWCKIEGVKCEPQQPDLASPLDFLSDFLSLLG